MIARVLFILAQVEILAELTLLALKLARQFGEILLLGAAFRLGHRQASLFQRLLQALHLFGQSLQILVALGEFLLDLLGGSHRRGCVPKQPLGIDVTHFK
jgi:hypothetical protein